MAVRTSSSLFYPVVSTAAWGGRATRAEVCLDAIVHNVRALRVHARSRELLAVVKADAYGHGAVMVGTTALQNGATRLAVYTVDEAIELRDAGIEAPVHVFGPFQSEEARTMVARRLTPTVTSFAAAECLQAAAGHDTVDVHVKIDTGLTRAGISPLEVVAFFERVSRLSSLRVEGLFTHFASADEANKKPTYKQFGVFMEAVARLEAAGFRIPVKHVANSGATLDLPEMHLDMVRAGITLYGCYPSPETSRSVSLRPALSLLSSVARVSRVPAKTGVGYGHEYKCRKETTIALIPIGYGDGLPRTLGHERGRVLIHGRPAPIIGRISMDQVTVDVTDLPPVSVGDDVVLIGESESAVQTAEDVADQAGTINYDILTGIMARVPRLYNQGGRIVAEVRPNRAVKRWE